MDEIPFDESVLELDDWGKLFSPSGASPRANRHNANHAEDGDAGTELDQSGDHPLESSFTFWESMQSESAQQRGKARQSVNRTDSIDTHVGSSSSRSTAMIDNRNLALLKKLHSSNTSKLMSALTNSKLDVLLSALHRQAPMEASVAPVPETSRSRSDPMLSASSTVSPEPTSLRDRRRMSSIDVSVPLPSPAAVGAAAVPSARVDGGTAPANDPLHAQLPLSPDSRSFFESLDSTGGPGSLSGRRSFGRDAGGREAAATLGVDPGLDVAGAAASSSAHAVCGAAGVRRASTESVGDHQAAGAEAEEEDGEEEEEWDVNPYAAAVPCTPRDYVDPDTPRELRAGGGIAIPTRRTKRPRDPAAPPAWPESNDAAEGGRRVSFETWSTPAPTNSGQEGYSQSSSSVALPTGRAAALQEEEVRAERPPGQFTLEDNRFLHWGHDEQDASWAASAPARIVLPTLQLPTLRAPAAIESFLPHVGNVPGGGKVVGLIRRPVPRAEAEQYSSAIVPRGPPNAPDPADAAVSKPKSSSVEHACSALVGYFGGKQDISGYFGPKSSAEILAAEAGITNSDTAVAISNTVGLDLRRVYDVLKVMEAAGFVSRCR
jgi:hypothetical protein